MKFYTVHFGQSLNCQDEILGHFRKLESAKRVFDEKVKAMQDDLDICGHGYETERPRENDVIFWYVTEYGRTDDWESVWISEEKLQ